MSAQLDHTTQPGAARRSHPLPASPPASVRPLRPNAARDTDRGLSLLGVFTGAMVVMVADVVLAAVVGHMWILVPVMAIHLLMTVAVFAAIMHLLADGGEGEASS